MSTGVVTFRTNASGDCINSRSGSSQGFAPHSISPHVDPMSLVPQKLYRLLTQTSVIAHRNRLVCVISQLVMNPP
jgi:hypothetical protein